MKTRMMMVIGIAMLLVCSAAYAEHGAFRGGCGQPGAYGAYGPYGAYGVNAPYNPYGTPYGGPAYGTQVYPAGYGAYAAGHDPYYLERKRQKRRTRNIILGVAAVALLSQLAR